MNMFVSIEKKICCHKGYRYAVLRIRIRIWIRIHRIHVCLGLLDPDPLVRGMDPDPDPSIIEQKM
jgi:hypothetical protein